MRIPGLGTVVKNPDLGWYRSGPMPVPVLGGALCRIVLLAYDDDPAREDFHDAIGTFLALDRAALDVAAPSIFAYYRDVVNDLRAAGDDGCYVDIDDADDVLTYVRVGDEPQVRRDPYGDRHVYVSIECECAWEPEHGLQIVFRDGATVTKVGPYDGHLTNSAAYADDALDGVVYRSHRP